ncbi:hypothetical protein BKA64DRAFT_654825, partial [Cadophora sp. MPI-SDFR-AT-0126]
MCMYIFTLSLSLSLSLTTLLFCVLHLSSRLVSCCIVLNGMVHFCVQSCPLVDIYTLLSLEM